MTNNDFEVLPIETEKRLKDLESDVRFLLSFAPQEVPGAWLDPTFYHTGTWKGDRVQYDRVEEIKKRLGKMNAEHT